MALDTRIPMAVPNVLAMGQQVAQTNALNANALGQGFDAVQRGMEAPMRRNALALDNRNTQLAQTQAEQQMLGQVLDGMARLPEGSDLQSAWVQAKRHLVGNGVFQEGELPDVFDNRIANELAVIASMPAEQLTDYERQIRDLNSDNPMRRQAAGVALNIFPGANAALAAETAGRVTLRPGDVRLDKDGNVIAAVPGERKTIKGVDGREYYIDTGEPVLPGETVPQKLTPLQQRAQDAGLQPGTPEYQQFMLNNGEAATQKLTPLQQRALDGGLVPGTPEYREFMLNGGLPKSVNPPKEIQIAQYLFPDDMAAQRAFVEKNPGGVNVQVGGEGMKLTEGQSKDLGFYVRGLYAMDSLEGIDDALTSLDESIMSQFGTIGNLYASPRFRMAKVAAQEFLAIVLRKDTGAAITDQEFETYGPIYLPMPGDDDAVLAEKRKMRQRVIGVIKMGLGTAAPLADDVNARFSRERGGTAPSVGTRQILDGVEYEYTGQGEFGWEPVK